MKKQATWTAALLFTSVIGLGAAGCQPDQGGAGQPQTQPAPPAGQPGGAGPGAGGGGMEPRQEPGATPPAGGGESR